jgi:hypothetical protein
MNIGFDCLPRSLQKPRAIGIAAAQLSRLRIAARAERELREHLQRDSRAGSREMRRLLDKGFEIAREQGGRPGSIVRECAISSPPDPINDLQRANGILTTRKRKPAPALGFVIWGRSE